MKLFFTICVFALALAQGDFAAVACRDQGDCPGNLRCTYGQCTDICKVNPDYCGDNANCAVINHSLDCVCKDGFYSLDLSKEACKPVPQAGPHTGGDDGGSSNTWVKLDENGHVVASQENNNTNKDSWPSSGEQPSQQESQMSRGGCNDDDNCAEGEFCIENQCVFCDKQCSDPYAECQFRRKGPTCQCKQGYVHKAGAGCQPVSTGCQRDSDCGNTNKYCNTLSQCVVKPTQQQVCSQKRCERNQECEMSDKFEPVCRCRAKFFDNKRNECLECQQDADCGDASTYCEQNKCVAKPTEQQVCQALNCPQNQECKMGKRFKAVCQCRPRYWDNRKKTCVECVANADCRNANTYCSKKSSSCVAIPTEREVCDKACGANTDCTMTQDYQPSCSCKDGYIGDPKQGCRRECKSHQDCKGSDMCTNYKCKRRPTEREVCENQCGQHANCKMYGFEPLCGCELGFKGNAYDRNSGCTAARQANAETCWAEDLDHKSPACEQYFTKKPAKQFHIVEQEATWFEALKLCKIEDQMLAIVENRIEQQQLESMLIAKDLSNKSFWMAGSDLKLKGRFQWVEGNSFNTMQYTNWQVQQPAVGDKRCVNMAQRFTWATEHCSQNRYFICQSVD